MKHRTYQIVNNIRDIRTYMKSRKKMQVPKEYTTTNKKTRAWNKPTKINMKTIDSYYHRIKPKSMKNTKDTKAKTKPIQASWTTIQHKVDHRIESEHYHKQHYKSITIYENIKK